MKEFRMDNTEGYTEKQLELLNAEYERLLIENNVDEDDDTLKKHYAQMAINTIIK
jgi:hypothetical protein